MMLNIPPQLLTFYCPFEDEVGPERDLLVKNTLDWARQFDLGEGDADRCTQLALTGSVFMAHVYPHARGPLAQALSDYSAWGWLTNDFSDSPRPVGELMPDLGRWERMMRAPASWPSSTRPAEKALRNVLVRLQRCMTAVQWQRFTAAQCHWMHAVAWTASLRAKGGEQTLDEKQWSRPDVRAAAEALMTTSVLDNDRYSHLRELQLPDPKHNRFAALRREHPEMAPEGAILEGVAIRDRCMNLYLALREQILVDADDDLKRYLIGLERIVSGNIAFAAKAVRYLVPDLTPSLSRTPTPSYSGTTPLPYPTIVWWWDHLHR
ncbi:terpene synthase family protein [Streptomyces sp. NPDC001118]